MRITPVVGLVAVAVTSVSAPAQDAQRPPRADVLVTVAKNAITAPDTAAAGWTRIRVEEDGGGHIAVLFRLSPTASAADVKTFLAVLDTAASTPKGGVAMGGPEVGDVGELLVRLTPGRYVVACVRAGSDGHRHAVSGEAKVLVVRKGKPDIAHASPPSATQRVRLLDFAFQSADKWAAGAHMIRVENTGRQDHQFRLVRLNENVTMSDWMTAKEPGRLAKAIAGMARIGPREVAYLPAELRAGTYVAHCLVTDPATHRQHVELGMVRAITVE